ncbi:MAG: hypothetical protein HY694_17155 [Deltaproteobacteria bacterium]|nr:hypothetical protein [Deltaproteobacteria bacterium]
MEYQVLKSTDSAYPARLRDKLGKEAPVLYYNGPLEFLSRWTLAVISSDSIGGLGMLAANQLLFTIREYDLNYIGGWHSVMETEIFRLGLFRKNTTVTLSSAKGLEKETFDSFLLDRFYPPLHEFPEREEYFRRANSGKLLILSVTEPNIGRTVRRNVMARNWVSCNLADAVFIPYAAKGTKTYVLTKRLLAAGILCFTSEDAVNRELHLLGVHGLTRKNVGRYLEDLGARKAEPEIPSAKQIVLPEVLPPEDGSEGPKRAPTQLDLLPPRKQSGRR